MKLSLGIDIGSSSTKAAALDEHGALLGTLQVHADDPRTSAYGVLGRFLDQQGASFDDVEKIVLTGLGSTYFHENIFGHRPSMPWSWMPSGAAAYTCPGLTKRWWSALEPALPLSALPRQTASVIWAEAVSAVGHLPAWRSAFSASPTFLPSQRWRCAAIRPWRSPHRRRAGGRCPGLAADLTAANFGRIKSGASDADLAAALFNMIYENVGVMASLALSRTPPGMSS